MGDSCWNWPADEGLIAPDVERVPGAAALGQPDAQSTRNRQRTSASIADSRAVRPSMVVADMVGAVYGQIADSFYGAGATAPARISSSESLRPGSPGGVEGTSAAVVTDRLPVGGILFALAFLAFLALGMDLVIVVECVSGTRPSRVCGSAGSAQIPAENDQGANRLLDTCQAMVVSHRWSAVWATSAHRCTPL